jgi:MFS family permease
VGEGRIIPISALFMAPAAALTPLAASGTVPAAALLIAGGAVFGFFVIVYNVAQVSFRQRVCPPALLGRMNASVRFIVWGTMPIGGLLGGWLGTHVGVLPTLWVSVALMAVSALPVLVSPLLGMRDLPGAPVVDEPEPAATDA